MTELERSQPQGRRDTVDTGQTPCIGKVNRGGETPKTRKGQMHPASTEAGDRVPARPSSQHCNYTEFVKTP